jgi:hypothetical protein
LRILTLENQIYHLNNLPDEVDDTLRFSIMDNSDPQNVDYFFIPLIYLESFTAPAAVLRIGSHVITMPLDWCTVIGDAEGPELEVLPLTSLNDRGFKTFAFNPLSSFRPEFLDIDIVDIYQDVKWYFPKMRPGQLLTVPLTEQKSPQCVYFVKEVSKNSELIDFSKCW